MDIKVNDYVRTKDGRIEKYSGTSNSEIENFTLKDIIKSSPRIIDLICVGDYVNGMEVTRISGTRWDKNDLYCYCEHNGDENWKQVMIPAKDIKSVLTKEMFEQMEYKID